MVAAGGSSSMAGNKSCGQHKELTANSAVRITQCACGMVHVTTNHNGVTKRMNADTLRNTWAGLKAAIDRIDEEPVPSFGSSIIN
jgi:hypothetical protein